MAWKLAIPDLRKSGFLLLFILISSFIVPLADRSTDGIPGKNVHDTRKTTQTNKTISPLLFGTNLALFDKHDQVLNSATTRALLQQLHVQIIRMPVRSSLSLATEIQAARIIKNLGLTPLVILRGEIDANVLRDDTSVIEAMNSVFGKSLVYYEYGNEEDLLGVPVQRYTASWNAVIPRLKQIALQGHFIGPVNYKYDQRYLTAFLQKAQPRPDEISWHEYTCDASAKSAVCIEHIDHWTSHITNARKTMQKVLGQNLPIMITEWNYAPNAKLNDGKTSNYSFMNAWTTKALQTLTANHIFASMQYSCTDTAIPLIRNNNTVTIQGSTFLELYQKMKMP